MGRVLPRVLAIALLLLVVAPAARADTLVVAGRKVASPVPFVVTGDEIYVPLVCALEPLRAAFAVGPDSINITTAAGREITLSRVRAEATVDGELRALPSAPKVQAGALLLPARAVGSLLGCAVRWDDKTRALSLTPAISRLTVETTPDCYRVTVAGQPPLSYQTKKVQGPPRLVVDFANAELAEPLAPYRVEGSYFRGARIAQNSLAPSPTGNVVRLVLDLEQWRPFRITVSEDRGQLQIELPLPDRELPSPAVVLSDFAFHRFSPEVAVATLAVSGKPVLRSGATPNPPAVWVEVENAENKVETARFALLDRFVKAATLLPVPERKGVQRLTLTLAESLPCTVSCDNSQVRLLLGRCELAGLTVAVDAGHGGGDTGAIGRSGLMEKDVNLDIAGRVGQLLEEAGAKVVYTRCDDTLPGQPPGAAADAVRAEQLRTRCAMGNDARADLFVSIHCNARGKDPLTVRGTETYYRRPESIPFAKVMQEEVVRALGLPDGGALYHPKSIVVLCYTEMPAVLVEVAYLSHPDDEALLAQSDFRQQTAQGIVNGVRRYVSESSLLTTVLDRQETPPKPSAPPLAPAVSAPAP